MKENKTQVRGELALIPLIFVNSFAVVLMLYSGSGIYFPYLLSFVVGFFFGIAVDLHQAWIEILPQGLAWRILYFCLSYLLICLGIALANRCKMPIVPTDLFPREFAQITGMPYSRVKIIFDVSCLAVTVFMTSTFLYLLIFFQHFQNHIPGVAS